MKLSQAALLVGGVGGLMCLLDLLLGKVKKDWKKLPWEEEEHGDQPLQ